MRTNLARGPGGAGLQRRDTESRELMDDPGCDPDRLERTYRQFSTINRLLSGWRRVYRQRIRPRLHAGRPATLLDIGFGGGDIARALARWAARDGLLLRTTAIDPDERAVRHVRGLPADGVHFEQASSADLVARGDSYDVVISNHLLHHLDPGSLDALLADSRVLARHLVIHNDLARGRAGYGCYAVATLPFARRSFIHQDGLLSIRRSYRRTELQAVVPPGWHVTSMFPQRLLLTLDGAPR
ncbi:methyltransferase domain-containing protein [Actinoplanes sp. N902-109]|uniref:methyltransferase domain-containing protein n=1 Tax=Actinoplanes sp. (strain N902-109) TaxID=649831 RepID=UPI0003293CD3|nr:methyltransferase domain-containing protein [Actinoplanes sp. N902-109]AGL16749.1 2-polyprenyl-3-methyl-5-hydroxy-6-metoxy-1,4-benzoquinol methylase [Actinoplanes sp. N902-109]